jgi:hypothetical protein
MPRLNVEDAWFDDPRRMALIRRGIDADGLAMRLWRLAQTYYRSGLLVPPCAFLAEPGALDFIDVGLACEEQDGIYVRGQDEHFRWLKLRSEAGKKGGNAPGKQNEATETKREQLEPSSSSSSSNTKNYVVSDDDLNGIYREYPRREGRAKAFAVLKATIKSPADLEALRKAVANYRAHCVREKTEKKFTRMFSTFVGPRGVPSWRDWIEPEHTKKLTPKNLEGL